MRIKRSSVSDRSLHLALAAHRRLRRSHEFVRVPAFAIAPGSCWRRGGTRSACPRPERTAPPRCAARINGNLVDVVGAPARRLAAITVAISPSERHQAQPSGRPRQWQIAAFPAAFSRAATWWSRHQLRDRSSCPKHACLDGKAALQGICGQPPPRFCRKRIECNGLAQKAISKLRLVDTNQTLSN